jgi:hypothetical protein
MSTRCTVSHIMGTDEESSVGNNGKGPEDTRAFQSVMLLLRDVVCIIGASNHFESDTLKSFIWTRDCSINFSPKYRILYYFWHWQLINYWDDCHLEPIPRPSSATEMNFQSVFECENVWSGRASARNRIRKERFSVTKLLNLESVRDCLSRACEGEYLKESQTPNKSW